MEATRQAMHPQRKRRFFTDLARLLDEKPPAVRPLRSAFFGPELLAEDRVNHSASSRSEATPAHVVPPHSLTSDSFESVQFGIPCTKPSGISSCGASEQCPRHDTMADSSLFLPRNNSTGSSDKLLEQHVRPKLQLDNKCRGSDQDGTQEEVLPVTILANARLGSDKASARKRLELVDYYDADRMCELTPCWLRGGTKSCEVHAKEVRRPMLLFCLQALDEFVAYNAWQDRQRWRVQACKLALDCVVAFHTSAILQGVGERMTVESTKG